MDDILPCAIIQQDPVASGWSDEGWSDERNVHVDVCFVQDEHNIAQPLLDPNDGLEDADDDGAAADASVPPSAGAASVSAGAGRATARLPCASHQDGLLLRPFFGARPAEALGLPPPPQLQQLPLAIRLGEDGYNAHRRASSTLDACALRLMCLPRHVQRLTKQHLAFLMLPGKSSVQFKHQVSRILC